MMSTADKLETLSCFRRRILHLQRHELFLHSHRQIDLPTFEVNLSDLRDELRYLERPLRALSAEHLPHVNSHPKASGQSSQRCSGLDGCAREAVAVLAALQRFLKHAC